LELRREKILKKIEILSPKGRRAYSALKILWFFMGETPFSAIADFCVWE